MPISESLVLRHIETDADYRASFPVMRELRPHLTDAASFAAQARRQAAQHYRLLAAFEPTEDGDDVVLGLAGYRLQENLIYGRFVYIDDLVTLGDRRSTGVGAALVDAVRELARAQDCTRLVLDTALGNARGQRFYFRNGLLSAGMHFNQTLA